MSPDPDQDDHRSVIYQLLQVSTLMLRTRDHYAAAVGVSSPQFSVLTAIDEAPGTSVGEIAARMHVTGAFVTAEVGKLVRRGLVEKTPSTHDKRVTHLHITESCTELLAQVAPLRQRANALIFDTLGDEGRARFSGDLLRLIDGLHDALHMLDRPEGRG